MGGNLLGREVTAEDVAGGVRRPGAGAATRPPRSSPSTAATSPPAARESLSANPIPVRNSARRLGARVGCFELQQVAGAGHRGVVVAAVSARAPGWRGRSATGGRAAGSAPISLTGPAKASPAATDRAGCPARTSTLRGSRGQRRSPAILPPSRATPPRPLPNAIRRPNARPARVVAYSRGELAGDCRNGRAARPPRRQACADTRASRRGRVAFGRHVRRIEQHQRVEPPAESRARRSSPLAPTSSETGRRSACAPNSAAAARAPSSRSRAKCA